MRNILLLVGFLSGSITTAQAQNTFEKIIDTLACDYASCIQETFDGGYVFCGKSSIGGNDVIIVKLDSIGTIEWAKVYGGPSIEGAAFIEQTLDSGYMVNALYDGGGLNAKSWLLRLDVNGDTLWTRVFSAGTGSTIVNDANSMASINNTIYGMTGYFKPQPITYISAYFISSTGNGIQLGNKLYNYSAFGTEAYAINKTIDGGFVISSAYGTSSSTNDFFLIRTNAFGDTIWTRTYDNSQNDAGRAVQQTADSGFVVVGATWNSTVFNYNIYLVKTNANGDSMWSKQYFQSLSNTPSSISVTSDNGFVITGRIVHGAPLHADLLLIKTNTVGDTLWTKSFGGTSADQGLFVRQTPDNGYIISGTGVIGSTYGAYIIKTDSMGHVSSSTGVAELNNPLEFNLYPNPSAGVFTIQVKGIPNTNSALEVYNISNQIVYTGKIQNYVNERVDLSHLPNGMYMMVIRMKEKIMTKKIIIQK